MLAGLLAGEKTYLEGSKKGNKPPFSFAINWSGQRFAIQLQDVPWGSTLEEKAQMLQIIQCRTCLISNHIMEQVALQYSFFVDAMKANKSIRVTSSSVSLFNSEYILSCFLMDAGIHRR